MQGVTQITINAKGIFQVLANLPGAAMLDAGNRLWVENGMQHIQVGDEEISLYDGGKAVVSGRFEYNAKDECAELVTAEGNRVQFATMPKPVREPLPN